MYQFGLKDFRGFHSINPVEVKPITLLIGENSAGKSSFLAGMKYALDFISASSEPSFNKDPFQLGTFQQIAHYRGGKAGRAREFRIRLETDVELRRGQGVRSAHVVLELTFVNGESLATIQSISLFAGADGIVMRLDSERLIVSFVGPNGDAFQLSKSDSFPRVARTDFARYWPFFLQDIRYRLQRKSDEPQLLPPDVDGRVGTVAEFAQAFSRLLTGSVEATSAIRTKPLRTYTPGTEVRDGEGSHVPFEMAKLYRARTKDAWRGIKSSLEKFGKSSDMFQEVNIKSFGQSASDPFQIQFSSDGPKTNLVDLGYGTSQVLPILYEVAAAQRSTRFLIQQPEVHLHPRAQAALGSFFVESYVRERKQFVLETHSDFIVDRIRFAISSGVISPNDVAILFFERKRLENTVTSIDLDSTGMPVDPPDSYRSFFIDEQMRVLGL